MRKRSVLFISMIFALTARGQQSSIPPMGQIEKEDLQMTTCDFDPEADAYILIKTGETSFIRDGSSTHLQTVYRYRIKILQDKAVYRANVKVNFYSKDDLQSADDVHGMTYNLDENGNVVTAELAKSNIYKKDISKEQSEIAFTLPDVRKGSVIEYTYTLSSRNYADIDNWYFQDAIPTRYCQFHFSVPDYLDFTYHVHKVLPMEEKSVTVPEIGKYFTMQNIPGLRGEPYMSTFKDYLQYIDFQLSAVSRLGMVRNVRTTWGDLNTEMLEHELLGGQLHKKISNTGDLAADLKGLKDSLAIMDTIYNYVRRHMDWNGQYGLFSQNGIKSAWDNKTGSKADINLLLVNLLQQAGLRAYPILVSTRGHGNINPNYPLLTQFNQPLAYVRIRDKHYVLDAVDKFTPPFLIPFDVQNSTGFILDKKSYGLVDLSDAQYPFALMVSLYGSLNAKGVVKGDASIYSYNYSKVFRCPWLQQGLDRFKNFFFTRPYPNIHVDSLAVTDQNNDSLPLDQELTFSSRLNATGDYLFFPINVFLGLEKNPFNAEHRFSDVNFGYRQSYIISGSLDIPEGYQFDNIPKNMRMIMQDTSIELERVMVVDSNKVDYRIQLRFNRPIYDVSTYDAFREFYKKLFAALNDPIVIRKKSQ